MQHPRSRIAALAVAVMLPSTAFGTTYYVSASGGGDDLNTGGAGDPFATLQRCVDEWNDVDQVTCLGEGVFHEELVIDAGGPSVDERNQILAWDTDGDGDLTDETFVLDGELTRNIGIEVVNGTHHVELGWLTVRNYQPDGGCGVGDNVHHVAFSCFGGCLDWWIHDCRFEDLGPQCDGGGGYISIRPRGAVRLAVERCSFDRVGGFIMRYYAGNDMVFRDNDVRIVSSGLKMWDVQPSIDGHGLTGYLFEGNTFTCDGNGRNDPAFTDCYAQTAIAFADDVSDAIVRDNVFIDCLTAIQLATDERFGSVSQSGFLIERNHCVVTDNVCNVWSGNFVSVRDCTGPSLNTGEQMVVSDLIIRNNLIERLSGGIRQNAISLMSGHEQPFVNNYLIEHNTFRGHHEGIRIDGCSQPYALNGITVRNNIFAGSDDRWFSLWSGAPPAGWVSDGNVFEPGAEFNWDVDYGFAGWQASTGQDLASSHCAVDFAGPRGATLSPTDTCAVDAGIAAAADEDAELESRPRGAAPDAGADELWPPFLLDLRVAKTAVSEPELHLANVPADLPAVRYARGRLSALVAGYEHASPFGAGPASPECSADPLASVVDEAGGTESWYYLAQSLVGRRAGAFRVDSLGRERGLPVGAGCP